MENKLKRLYKKGKTGAVMICDISVEGDTIQVLTGQLDGVQTPHSTKCYPKNEGKKNATTGEEQAQKEAKAKHAKKIKKGYVLDSSGEQTVRLPMRVKKYQDQKKNVIFPCWLSPKLNGVNGEVRTRKKMGGTDLDLYSRGGEMYPFLGQIYSEVLEVMRELKTETLNGEIYKHGMALQDITSAVVKPNQDTPGLGFYVFDIPDSTEEYRAKIVKLRGIQDRSNVKIIHAVEAKNHQEIDDYLELCLADGYEGIIVRNSTAVYEYNTQSSDVFKYKLPDDAEYQIVGYKIDKYGHAVFRCKIPDADGGHEFSVKMKGTSPERLRVAAIADTYIGQWLKVEFEVLSNDLKPLKPVGICLRKCDADGKPLE